MDKPRPDLTVDDLFKEIAAQLGEATEDGMTVRELCLADGLPATGCNLSRVRKKLDDMLALGQARYVGKKNCQITDGSWRRIQAYALVEPEG